MFCHHKAQTPTFSHTPLCASELNCHVPTTLPPLPAFLLLNIVWRDIVCGLTLSEEKVNSVPEQRPFDIPVSSCQGIFACLTTVQEELYQHYVSLTMFHSAWIWQVRGNNQKSCPDKRKSCHFPQDPFICMVTGTMWALRKFRHSFKARVFSPNNSGVLLKTGLKKMKPILCNPKYEKYISLYSKGLASR